MRAIMVPRHGDPGVVVVANRPTPAPGEGHVLIAAEAIGVNYPDLLVVGGTYQNLPPLPFTPGKEVAGVVVAVGGGVTLCKPGDRVMAQVEYGAYAEQVAVPEHACQLLPESLAFDKAAAMGLVYQTAHFALIDRGLYRTGETVLVTGATGGVGLAAVQLAKALGAVVIAGARGPAHADALRANGADHVIDLAVPNLRDGLRDQVRAVTVGRGADVILEQVGGAVFDASLRALAWRGRLVVVGFAAGAIPSIKANYLLVKNISVSGLQWSDYRDVHPDWVRAAQKDIFALYETGRIDPQIMARYPLEGAATALTRLKAGRLFGKIVLTTR